MWQTLVRSQSEVDMLGCTGFSVEVYKFYVAYTDCHVHSSLIQK